ncbi:MAG: ABC transporter substrate-binding protein [Rhizobiaceae bacterium]|nr:ABC transporter substrate-binding protein [Rhizobiaceae bacterium]
MKRVSVKVGLAVAVVIAAAAGWMSTAVADRTVSLPTMAYRTGPFAASGVPLLNGMRDYVTLLNERDGGVNGVTLVYEECETAFTTEKGLECYERAKARGLVAQPWSATLMVELLKRAATDKMPILAPGYGFSAMADGLTFEWAFTPPSSMADGMSMILKVISDGNLARLERKTVALLHFDAPNGADGLPFLNAMAEKYGFEVTRIPVSAKEMQNQTAQWRRIADEKPDFVLLWGWGPMNQTALVEAAKVGYPMRQIVGIWSSAHDGDFVVAGQSARGYRALSWNLPNSNAPAMRAIRALVVNAGKSSIDPKSGEFDSVFYQRGVLVSMIGVEAFRKAQMQFDSQVVTAEQMRWGLENLDLSDARLKELGVDGMIGPFKTSCTDHSGHAGAWMLEWDGARFTQATEMLVPEQADVAAVVAQQAKHFAEENKPWPVRKCS